MIPPDRGDAPPPSAVLEARLKLLPTSEPQPTRVHFSTNLAVPALPPEQDLPQLPPESLQAVSNDPVHALTARQHGLAERAAQVVRSLAYPSLKTMLEILKSARDPSKYPLEPIDFARAYDMLLKDEMSPGKSVVQKQSIPRVEHDQYETHRVPQNMYSDLMYAEGYTFLVSHITPLGMTFSELLPSKSHKDITAALRRQIVRCEVRKFPVAQLYYDGETGLSDTDKVEQAVGVPCCALPVDHHAPRIEVEIKVDKERARALCSRFELLGAGSLPRTLIPTLVAHVINRRCGEPPSQRLDNTPALEIWRGRRLDLVADASLAFGDMAMVSVPKSANYNTLQSRTEPAIVLTPCTGGYWVVLINSWTRVRRKFTAIFPQTASAKTLEAIRARAAKDEEVRKSEPKGAKRKNKAATVVEETGDCVQDKKSDLTDIAVYQEFVDGQERKENNDTPTIHNDRPANHSEEKNDGTPPITNDSVPGESQTPDSSTERTDIQKNTELLQDQTNRILDSLISDVRARLRSATRNVPVKRKLSNSQTDSEKYTNIPRSLRSSRRRPQRFQVNNLTVQQAESKYGSLATKAAVMKEITQILDYDVMEPVYGDRLNTEQRQKVIRTLLFLKAKTNSAGVFIQLKARLCGRGDMEDKTTFESLFSPTGSLESALSVLSIAAFERRKTKVIDLVAAYLTIPVLEDSETYVELGTYATRVLFSKAPHLRKYETKKGTFIGLLNKSLYGICQAASNLHKTLCENFGKLGFKANPKDDCVFNGIDEDGKQITCLIYVDDILITAFSDKSLDSFTASFQKHHPDITQKLGPVFDYLGMKVDMSVPGQCSISMQGYINKLVENWRVAHEEATISNKGEISGRAIRKTSSPGDDNLFTVGESAQLSTKSKADFHSLTATILFLAKRARPDVLVETSYLTTRIQNSTVLDWYKLRRVISFLHLTAEKRLVLKPCGIYIEAYNDAAFATHADKRSHTGIVCTIGGAPYYCSSVRQTFNAKSAAEAEMIATSDAGTMIQWGQQFLQYQGYRAQLPPATVWEDNEATIKNLKRGSSSAARSRHYDIKMFYLADLAKRGIVTIKHLGTKEMTADLLTKGKVGHEREKLSNKLMNSFSDVASQKNLKI